MPDMKKIKSYWRRQSQRYEIPQFRPQLRVSIAYPFHRLHNPEANPRNQNFSRQNQTNWTPSAWTYHRRFPTV